MTTRTFPNAMATEPVALRPTQLAWLAAAVFVVSAGYGTLMPLLPGWLAPLMPGFLLARPLWWSGATAKFTCGATRQHGARLMPAGKGGAWA